MRPLGESHGLVHNTWKQLFSEQVTVKSLSTISMAWSLFTACFSALIIQKHCCTDRILALQDTHDLTFSWVLLCLLFHSHVGQEQDVNRAVPNLAITSVAYCANHFQDFCMALEIIK